MIWSMTILDGIVVCLPHRLVIRLEEKAADMESFDAVAR